MDLLLEAPESVINAVPDESPDVEGAYFPPATAKDFKDMKDEESGIKEWLDRISKL